MKHFGIIGKPLVQSFSANHFNKKFADEHIDAEYSLYPLEQIEDFPALIQSRAFAGMNVTIPYKSAVIPYLSELDETAREIGAVNVIRFLPDGRTIGYNTDALGFIDAIRPMLRENDKTALILGTGGAAKACHYGLKKLGLEVRMVSRTPKENQLSYSDLQLSNFQVIVNCTPLGMYPHTEECPDLPYEAMDNHTILYDLIYNPDQTLFMRKGAERGADVKNGLEMLLLQAFASWEFWNGKEK